MVKPIILFLAVVYLVLVGAACIENKTNQDHRDQQQLIATEVNNAINQQEAIRRNMTIHSVTAQMTTAEVETGQFQRMFAFLIPIGSNPEQYYFLTKNGNTFKFIVEPGTNYLIRID